MSKTFIIAEIGINHNGDLEIAKQLIDGAVAAGCDMVKFQKRTLDLVYTKADLDRPREEGKHTFVSTGMSTVSQIEAAIKIFQDANCPFELMHCCSTYPMEVEDANLNTINTLRNTFGCNGFAKKNKTRTFFIAAISRCA